MRLIVEIEDDFFADCKENIAEVGGCHRSDSFQLRKIIRKGIPYEEHKTEWIPVTERLPDKDGEYLVTKWRVSYKHKEQMVTSEWWISQDNSWSACRFGWEIVAWTEMPTPYEGSEE